MDVKVIKPVGGTAKGASISKYTPNRQGGESGRRQPFSDSYKPKTEQKGIDDLDRFFANTAQKPAESASDFELLFRKIWEDTNRMQNSARAIEQKADAAESPLMAEWVWGMYGNFRPAVKK